LVFGVERPRLEADYSLPNNAEIKEMWIYIKIAPYAFMV
jgi:hypothetical protein